MSNKFDGMWGREIKEREQPQPPQPEARLSACCSVEIISTTICSKCRTFHAAERPADEDEWIKEAAQEIHDWIFEPPGTWPIRGEATVTQITSILHRLLDRQQVVRSEHVGECRDATTKPSV